MAGRFSTSRGSSTATQGSTAAWIRVAFRCARRSPIKSPPCRSISASSPSFCEHSRRPQLGSSRYREVPRIVDPDLNDVRVGELEGKTLDAYRDWKHGKGRDDPFPGGESLNDAARRYADAFERLLGRPEEIVLVVCHEIPVRYAINAAGGTTNLDAPLHDIPNATPYLFDPPGLERAVAKIRELAG